jgi:hypothetical protein
MSHINTEGEFYQANLLRCFVTAVTMRRFIGFSSSRWYAVRGDFNAWEFQGETYYSLVEAIEYRMERKGKRGKRPNRTMLLPVVGGLANLRECVA